MAATDPLRAHLADIVRWCDAAPDPAELHDDEAMMNVLCDGMARALYLLRAAASVAADDTVARRGVSRHRAVVVGHMIRLCKLYDAFYMHVAKNQMEIAGVLSRLLFETEIRISYFIERGTRKSVSSYVLGSYRAEKDCLLELKATAAKRRLTPFEKRIKARIAATLKADGVRQSDLLANKTWDVDGKSVRAMLQALGREWEYGYGFAMQSRWVHGSWLELKDYQLSKQGRYYSPALHYAGADVRVAAPITCHCLRLATRYLAWSKGDPDNLLRSVIDVLAGSVAAIDEEHEHRIVARTTI